MDYLTIPAFAILNRARGSQLFGLTDSTTLGRLVSMMGIALMISLQFMGDSPKMAETFFWTWASLMLWCVPAWDPYWSAEIGNDPSHSKLWGLGKMSLRMTLAAPCIIGLAFLSDHPGHALYALLTPLLGLPYLLWGYVAKSSAIPLSEYTVGAMLGTIATITIS